MLPAISWWNLSLVVISLLAIAGYFLLQPLGLPAVQKIAAPDIPLLTAIVIGGVPLALQILRKLFRGDFGADLLAVLALATAAWMGQYLAGVLIVLMLAGGQALEAYAMRKASSVLLTLSERMPATAHRKQDGQIQEIPLMDIRIGNTLVIYPHETVVADGTVIEGNGGMNEAYLTGEPYLVSKAPGASVLSGAINGEAALTIRAEKLPADSRYATLMKVMQEAEQKRPALRRIGDQIGAVFAPVAFAFALAAYYFTGNATRFLAVLVTATPCPLLIAIPITLISAISIAARRGIVIKDPTVLERLPTCRTAIFDKTGTLTYGQPDLTEILPAEGFATNNVLQLTASIERYSRHPLASSILRAAEKENVPLLDAASVSEKPGHGLTGTVAGHEIHVTSRKKLSQSAPEMIDFLPPTSAGLECIILLDNRYAATLRFRDAPRAESKSFVSHLSPMHQFDKVMLVSGDRESEVRYLADRLGILETLASQSPEQKVAIVRTETAKAPTLFMGDGINDAPALASATVGIAFGQHSVTAEAAGAVVMESTLKRVDELIHISSAMRSIALQSAIGGMILSFVAMGFAAGGYITPVEGAILQEAIDVMAILNALRLSWTRRIKIDI